MRIRPDGPSAARTAATRATSAARSIPGSATLILTVRHPDSAASSAALSGPTTGMIALTGTRSRRGAGHGFVADSIAGTQPRQARPRRRSRRTARTRPSPRAPEQHACADGDAPEPVCQWDREDFARG